jgi:hypothetical protein
MDNWLAFLTLFLNHGEIKKMIPLQRIKIKASEQARFLLLFVLQAAFFALVFLFLALPQLLAQTTSGAVKITAVSGASFVEEDLRIFYGGTTDTGDLICSGSELCNSCQGGASLVPCNENEVTDSSLLSITFTWNGENKSNARLSIGVEKNSNNSIPQNPSSPLINLIKGQSYTVSSTWGRICQMACGGGVSGCRECDPGEKSRNLSVGVDEGGDGEIDDTSNAGSIIVKYHRVENASSSVVHCPDTDVGPTGGGVCFFDIFPGDKKLYLDKLTYTSDFPINGSVSWAGIDILYAKGNAPADLSSIRNNSDGAFFSLTSDSDKNIKVLDLENNTSYCVILASRSKAGNITNFYPPASQWASAPAGRYCGEPQEVYGLLDSKKCFIATASFGSEMDSRVQRFRDFRDQFLNKNDVGRKFVVFYYKNSPEWAAWLDAHSSFKPASRSVLWVLLFFIEIYLSAGIGAFAISLAFSLLFLVFLLQAVFFRKTRRLKISKKMDLQEKVNKASLS